MRLLEEAMYGELPGGDLPYEELALVYEMSAVWQAEGLLMQVIVERPADKSISAEEYAEQIRDDLNILDGSNVTYLVDDRFYSADISGQEFINFGYTTYYDEGISLRQENYIKKQDDRIIVINITGADATENGMQRLLDSFVPYEN